PCGTNACAARPVSATIAPMVGRLLLSRAEPGFTLPAYERLSPAAPPELVHARLEANSASGDIVADLHGRGGWIARAAIDRQRRGVTLETAHMAPLGPSGVRR